MSSASIAQLIILSIQIPVLIFSIIGIVRLHNNNKKLEKAIDKYYDARQVYSAKYNLITKKLDFIPINNNEHYGDCNYCKRCPDGMTLKNNSKLLCYPCKWEEK